MLEEKTQSKLCNNRMNPIQKYINGDGEEAKRDYIIYLNCNKSNRKKPRKKLIYLYIYIFFFY